MKGGLKMVKHNLVMLSKPCILIRKLKREEIEQV